MSRWRKVKQGKVKLSSKNIKESKKCDHKCAPVTLRLKAFIVDSFMIMMPILYIVFYFVMGGGKGFQAHMAQGWLIIFALNMAIVLAFWKIKAQTPGMKAYNLYLIDNKSGEKTSFVKLILRYVMLQITILSFLGLFLPYLLKSKKGLHDLVSDTCIVWKP